MADGESDAECKPTRQWDAWTREEEEIFFRALRQVGKNFEKITSRVQSKNKDQVRHYYYRLIKRMNRILDPQLILDARNSSYVNIAMLRWWSLLEKHSCSASKLRLKPRRFKTFVTALEHQLLKDLKKPKPKSSPQSHATAASKKHPSLVEGNGVVTIEPGLVSPSASGRGKSTSQSGKGSGSGRKAAVKRKAAGIGPRKSGAKGESKQSSRPRKKSADGCLTKAAYARWEKAASLGVALVAEAAEQLELAAAAGGSQVRNVQTGQPPAVGSDLGLQDETGEEGSGGRSSETNLLSAVTSLSGTTEAIPTSQALVTSVLPASLKGIAATLSPLKLAPATSVMLPELQRKRKPMRVTSTRCNNCSNLSFNDPKVGTINLAESKLKVQLFPFDESTRKALEQDGHNPHLELTLKGRKSISSVLQHLTQKWGRSGIASGELRLYPFSTQWANISTSRSWGASDLGTNAADVHAALGSPHTFRLRYAWLSSRLQQSSSAVLQEQQQPLPTTVLQKAAQQWQDCGASSQLQCQSTVQEALSSTTAEILSMHISPFIEAGNDKLHIVSTPTTGVDSMADDISTPSLCIPLPVSLYTSLTTDTKYADPTLEPIQEALISFTAVDGKSEADLHNTSLKNPAGDEGLYEEDFGHSGPQLSSTFLHCESEVAEKSGSKYQESASQVSGCSWLYESNDGFAQQLWNDEDALRSNNGAVMAQMDWVDSLTNISVSELLGEVSRGGYPVVLDGQCPVTQPELDCLGITAPATHVSSTPLMPTSVPQSTLWGGDETCDAFSFRRMEKPRNEPEGTISKCDGVHGSSIALDVSLGDFHSIASWREVGSSDAGLPQSEVTQSHDLPFTEESSLGIGSLIEALAHGSLDGFSYSVDQVEVGSVDTHSRQDCTIAWTFLCQGLLPSLHHNSH